MFGIFVKEKRLEKNLSLREFCRRLGEDASNWSKIEREVMKPPKDKEKLERIADILGIEKGSEDWNSLFDFADIDWEKIPDYVMRSEEEVLKLLPIFFRTIGNVRPNKSELEKLIKIIKRG